MYYEPCTTESLKECIFLGCLKYAFGKKAGVLKMGGNLEKKSEDNVFCLLTNDTHFNWYNLFNL